MSILPPRISRALALALATMLSACAGGARPASAPAPGDDPPLAMREFRGVWVASVANIDWPSQPGLPVAQQQAELLAILDQAAAMRMNGVLFQVRPAADALYPSALEPWSEYLTGEQGRAPEPLWDPLQFAVDEAHRRGLELHAWFNPYRARHPAAKSPPSPGHIAVTHPELVRSYGGFLWMDPGQPAVADHTLRVMMDVVRRYDVDGLHIDDYFYPYPATDSAGKRVPFPDDASYGRYVRGGGTLSRDDWRRRNVDDFVRRMYGAVKREKPWVKVGISPFGIWRPGHPAQVTTGFDQYADIYADARRWLREGWTDYFSPQLYWPIAQTAQSYPVLLRWWAEENVRDRHLWPGLFTSRTWEGNPTPWRASEVLGQVYATRGRGDATGHVHFSMKAFRLNRDSLTERMTAEAYREPALVPASPWLGGSRLPRPRATLDRVSGGGATLRMEPAGRTPPTWWLVRARYGDAWRTHVLPGWRRDAPLSSDAAGELVEVRVTPVGRTGREGETATVR